METKKSPGANLEKKRILFLEVGFVIALGICLAAFEWSEEEISEVVYGSTVIFDDTDSDIVIPVTPPPPTTQRVIAETIIVRPDDLTIETTPEISDEETEYLPETDYSVLESYIPEEKPEVFSIGLVDQKPLFPGGDAALLSFIKDNIHYPPIPKENNIQGKVYIQFVIGRDGKVSNLTVVKSADRYLDQEALRVVSLLPDWTPGVKGGKLVPVSYIIPINFIIR